MKFLKGFDAKPLSICWPVHESQGANSQQKMTTHTLNPIPLFANTGAHLMPRLANDLLPGCTVSVKFTVATKLMNGVAIFNAIPDRMIVLDELVLL
ncbi:hypothetical protein K439DRAFT_629767 [Ramaria rubella]|nr:hypothetical protein K439DRAFT_629767 [Ramaria rubella]